MNVSFKQLSLVSPNAGEELRHSLALLNFLQSDDLKTVFAAVAEADFSDFNPETVSKEEAEGLLAFLQIAEVFVPFAANQPILQSLVPAEVWRAMVNVYQKVKPHRELLEGKINPPKSTNERLENYRRLHRPMTLKEQVEYQKATKSPVRREEIVGQWPGNETYEELVAMLNESK